MKAAVVNASPLIVLARAGCLDLLPKLFSSVVVPRGVIEEITAGPAEERSIIGTPWLSVVDITPTISPLATSRLGRGETELLEFARLHTGTVSILDDRAARRAALMLGLPLTGTLGILAAAVEAGHLDGFEAAAEEVQRAGLYISPAIVADLAARLRKS